MTIALALFIAFMVGIRVGLCISSRINRPLFNQLDRRYLEDLIQK